MRVLYVDIYFLINFCVDLISLFFSARILHLRTSVWRLVLLSAFGAVMAIVHIISGENIFVLFILSAAYILSVALMIAKRLSLARRIKCILLFIALEIIIGGIVYFVYNLLDTHFNEFSQYVASGDANRRALVLSLIILLVIGVLKIFIMIFSGQIREKSMRLKIELSGKVLETDALIDSGNLVRDPMSRNPVIFIKSQAATAVVPDEIIELSGIDGLDYSLRRRIRLVPVTREGNTHVMTGFVPDRVIITEGGRETEVTVTVVIDKGEGTFGGYDALVPLSIT